MNEFIAAMYLIMRDGEPVTIGRFHSSEELVDQISRLLPEGVYRIYRLSSITSRAGPGSNFWGEVTNHGGACATYCLASQES
jgi:hypothetical protein